MDCIHNPPECNHELLVHHGGPSPINNLPNDVLSEVFLASLSSSASPPNIRSPPLIFGRICRSWRKLALDMPLLWNHIVGQGIVQPGDQDTAATTAQLKKDILAVDEYLTRSKSSSLYISLHYATHGVEPPPPYFITKVNAIVRQILPHSQRWHNIRLNIPDETVQTLFTQFALGVPRLTSMFVTKSGSVHQFRGHTLTINLSSAQHLERLYILIPTDVDWGNTVMHRMRELNLKPTSASSFLQCIGKCPSLTSVEFCAGIHTPSVPLTEIHILRLSCLVKCRLYYLDQDQFSGLLDSLHLPVLRYLELFTKRSLSDSSSFVRFMHRSQPPLEVLSLIIHGMPTADLLDCLRRTPRLTVLRTHIAHFTGDAIQRFLTPSSTHDGSILCPNLMSMWLIGKSDHAFQNAAKLVVHRCHNASEGTERIRHVWISDSEKRSFLECDGIAECSKEGLKVGSRDGSWIEYWLTGQWKDT